jgi:asparagine synthase (glutamine-hydrolysing)
MYDTSGRYVIVFNGEIYNYRELRAYLDRKDCGLRWKSGSDTEVILEGYRAEGESFLEKLNGIFAFCLYDRIDKTLMILRDPLGVKPLLVTEQHGNAYFCSELEGLLRLGELKRTLRRDSVAENLAFMYIPEPHTILEEFRKVEPGILYTYRCGTKIRAQRLYSWLFSPVLLRNSEEAVERFAEELSGAVKRQLVSDAPVSLMLSGGLDSSSVAFHVVSAGADVRDAYTVCYDKNDLAEDEQGDDLRYATLIAERLGLRLEVISAERDFLSMVPILSRFLEAGVSDPAALNTYLICRAARSGGVKVLLTGHGADEYLGGYRRYVAHQLLANIPGVLRPALYVACEIAGSIAPRRFNAVQRRAQRLAAVAAKKGLDQLLSLYTWTEPRLVEALFIEPRPARPGHDMRRLFEEYRGVEGVTAMMRVDQRYDLMSLNLTYTDRMSMAASVEARVPFLDFNLVRVMNSIPTNLKIRRGKTKYVLKKVMESHLPDEVLHRAKTGFGLPIRSWLKQANEPIEHYLDKETIKRQGIFDHTALESVLNEHFAGRKNHAYLVFALLCFQVWLESHPDVALS